MLRDALSTPTRTDDAAGVLVVGTVLTLLTWTVVPVWLLVSLLFPPLFVLAPVVFAPPLVLRGYFLRVVAGGLAAADEPIPHGGAPSFVRWGGLYRDGLKSVLLSACYLLPLAVLVGAGALAGAFVSLGRVDLSPVAEGIDGGGTAGIGVVGSEVIGSETVGVGAVGIATADAVVAVIGGFVGVLALGYLVAFAYLRPAALALFASSGRLRDGLRPGRVLAVAASGDYAAGWVLAAVTLLTGYALAAPFVPLLVGIGVVFATRLVVHALYGHGAADAIARLDGDAPTRPRVQATHTDDSAHTGDSMGSGDEPVAAATGGRRGRPSTDEPPPAVQTGRSVPRTATDVLAAAAAREAAQKAERGRVARGRGRAARDRSESEPDEVADEGDDASGSAGFDWGPSTEEPRR